MTVDVNVRSSAEVKCVLSKCGNIRFVTMSLPTCGSACG